MKSIILLLGISLYSALAFSQDCAPVTITGGNGQISITGLSGAPIAGVQVFNSSWSSVFNQTYTNPNNVTVSPLAPGQYFVNVRLYNSNWSTICEKGANATVTDDPPPTGECGPTFQKNFGTSQGNEEAFEIIKSADGAYITVGQASVDGTTNHNASVMKFDSKGDLLWSKTLGNGQEEYLEHIVGTPDGGFVAGGSINSSGVATHTGDCWLTRFDASGNIIWQKRFFVTGNAGHISFITQTSDGGFAFAGTFPYTPGLSDVMVVKVDANGNIQWVKRLGSGNSDSGIGMIEDDHGGAGLIVTAILYSGSWYDAVITKLDLAAGNVLWTKAYDFDSRANWVRKIFKVSDGLIYNVINANGFGTDNAKPGILKTDFNGNILWMKEFTIPNCREGKMTVLPDGGFMMVQVELPVDNASNLHLMRIDAAGNIMWAKKYPYSGAQWLNGLVSDGNFVVGAGFSTVGSYKDLLLLKVDLDGKIGICNSENVTATTRNCVVTNLNFTWPTNTTIALTTENTTFPLVSNTPVETVFCTDDCAPQVTISNVTVSESAGNAVLQVCLAAPAAGMLVYPYTTGNGSATSGSDYTGGSGTVTIPAGQTCGTITIPIVNDGTVESTENFTVSIGSSTGTVTINDDDQAQNNCSAVTFTPGNNQISISGITAPVATVQVFNSSWATVFNQTYTNSPGAVNVPIAPGTYLVKVTFYTSNWAYVCDKSENVTVVNNCPAGTICIS
ncbi:MAG TPA: Calx-beta domain-containing protein, partial [Chitinophagaceae bacterium]|nr:Calx-beta domain-containing protein [Chitinophagaceae bacterium]